MDESAQGDKSNDEFDNVIAKATKAAHFNN